MFDRIEEFVATHPWLWIAIIAHFGILGTVAYMILLERKVTGIKRLDPSTPGGPRIQLMTSAGETFLARSVILTTGGLSCPRTGSDGVGYALAELLVVAGVHTI